MVDGATSYQVSGTVESSLLVTSVPVLVPGVPVPQSSGRHFSTPATLT